MCSVTEGTSSSSGFPFNLLSLQPLLDAPWALQPLTPHSLLSSESKLVNIRKDILEQVQNECQSRSQQLITELTGFMKAFQTISSDIHSIAWCSQKVGAPNPSSPAYPGPTHSRAKHTPFRSLLSSQWGSMPLNCIHRCDLPWPVLTLFTWPSVSS